eukprot:scaffold92222_cov67-Phaeocystis_antarctica.AAC.3
MKGVARPPKRVRLPLSTLYYPLRRRSSWRSSKTTSRWSRSSSDTSPSARRASRLAPALATVALQRLRCSSAHVAASCFNFLVGPRVLPPQGAMSMPAPCRVRLRRPVVRFTPQGCSSPLLLCQGPVRFQPPQGAKVASPSGGARRPRASA